MTEKRIPGPGAESPESLSRVDPSPRVADPARRPLPFESLLQEVIRRAASLGFSSLFLTEEAIRKAFNEVVPQDWVDYVSRHGSEVRGEMIERLAEEFTSWLRTADPAQIIGKLLEDYEISATVRLSAEPRQVSGPPAESPPGARTPRK